MGNNRLQKMFRNISILHKLRAGDHLCGIFHFTPAEKDANRGHAQGSGGRCDMSQLHVEDSFQATKTTTATIATARVAPKNGLLAFFSWRELHAQTSVRISRSRHAENNGACSREPNTLKLSLISSFLHPGKTVWCRFFRREISFTRPGVSKLTIRFCRLNHSHSLLILFQKRPKLV